MSVTWNLYKFQEEPWELEGVKPKANLSAPAPPASFFPLEEAARYSIAVILNMVYLFQLYSLYGTGLVDSWVWIHNVNQL